MVKEEKFKITTCTKCKERFFGSGKVCFNCRTGTKKRTTGLEATKLVFGK